MVCDEAEWRIELETDSNDWDLILRTIAEVHSYEARAKQSALDLLPGCSLLAPSCCRPR